MNDKIGETNGVLFELDGILYPDMNSAIAAAMPALSAAGEAHFRAQNLPGSIAEFGVRTFEAVEPPGAVVLEATAFVTDATGKKEPWSCKGAGCKFIRVVEPSSPTYGKHVPQPWSRMALEKWLKFNEWADYDEFGRATAEEIHCCKVACWINPCTEEQTFLMKDPREPFESLVAEINRQWKEAKTELKRDRAAEYLLCALDLGLVTSFHEILHQLPEAAARAGELARIREIASGHGA
jgi:hypothetical protein